MTYLDQIAKLIGYEIEDSDIRQIIRNGIAVTEQFHKLAISYTNQHSEMTTTAFVIPDEQTIELIVKSFKEAEIQAEKEMEIERQVHLKEVFELVTEVAE